MSNIMLVEDEAWLGDLYTSLLSAEHHVTWLRDGYDAMESIGQTRPDVIVLDILLPWVNGIQLLHELASYSDTACIPVVLFSAALPSDLGEEVLRAYGVVAALDKTVVRPAYVVKTINGILKTHANL